jgi:hypothetical protein
MKVSNNFREYDRMQKQMVAQKASAHKTDTVPLSLILIQHTDIGTMLKQQRYNKLIIPIGGRV